MDYVGIRVVLPNGFTVGQMAGAITSRSDTLKTDTEYIFQFKIINYSSNNILNNIIAIDEDSTTTVLSDSMNITSFDIVNTFKDEGITKNEYLCYISFTPPKESKYCFGICRTITSGDTQGKLFDIREVSCEKGSILQDFKDNSNDLQDFIRICQTYFEQTDQRISLLAKREDVYQTKDDTDKEIYNTKEEVYSEITANTDSINLSVNNKIQQVTTNLEGQIESSETLLRSEISLASDSILLEVEKKVDGDSIISSINMSPEEIQIQAEKVNMTGALNLNGTFTCYGDVENQSGNYLYQADAIHRGYLQGQSNPCFSSGIWRPDGYTDVGYVSVGLTNSDHVDTNGCLWMSPESSGATHLYYSRLYNSQSVFSGFQFAQDGKVHYSSFLPNKTVNNYYSHIFDGGISTHSIYGSSLTCGAVGCTGNGTFNGSLTVDDYIYLNSNLRVNNQIYTTGSNLWFGSGGLNARYMLTLRSDGYFLPKGGVQLGDSSNPFWQLVCSYSPSVVSDARKKENISYIKSNTDASVFSLEENNVEGNDVEENITIDDMYDYIKDIPLATYDLKQARSDIQSKRQMGFLAQDIMESKVGSYVVDTRDEDNLAYDTGNRIAVLEGALKKAIDKIEILESIILDIMDNKEV